MRSRARIGFRDFPQSGPDSAEIAAEREEQERGQDHENRQNQKTGFQNSDQKISEIKAGSGRGEQGSVVRIVAIPARAVPADGEFDRSSAMRAGGRFRRNLSSAFHAFNDHDRAPSV